jgi:hypothetical protein
LLYVVTNKHERNLGQYWTFVWHAIFAAVFPSSRQICVNPHIIAVLDKQVSLEKNTLQMLLPLSVFLLNCISLKTGITFLVFYYYHIFWCKRSTPKIETALRYKSKNQGN